MLSPGRTFQVAVAERVAGASICYVVPMTWTLKARVRGGRLVLDEPVDMPEGAEVDLVALDEGDALDDEDRARLHAALRRSAEQLRTGQGIDADRVIGELHDDRE